MATLIYSPGVRVLIDTEKHGILDVSEDLIEGSMVRRSDGVSTFDFTMNNARRKYDGVFAPNDRIIVLMKRVTWLRVFTGLLNSAPLRTAWPQPVNLSASCSLKRLQYWFWDPYNKETQNMLHGVFQDASYKENPEGMIVTMITEILEKVVEWPRYKVHVGRIPEDWFNLALTIATRLDSWAEDADRLRDEFLSTLGPSGMAAGQALAGNVSGVLTPGKYGEHTLTAQQLRNAEVIYSVGSQMGMSARDIQIALATAYQESTLMPKTQAESDLDSAGLFQQRTSQGWGTVEQIMKPEYASKKFYEALKKVKNRDGMPIWQAAYTVQRCDEDYKMLYQNHVRMAEAIVSKINASTLSVDSAGKVGSSTNEAYLAEALNLVEQYPRIQYDQGTRSKEFLMKNPPKYLDCSSFVAAIYLRTTGKMPPATNSASQSDWCGGKNKLTVKEALNTQGALLFKSGHVEVSLGNGKSTVGAHSWSSKPEVGVANYSQDWTHGGLMPGISYLSVGKGGGPSGAAGSAATTLVGGTGHYPVQAKEVTTAYKKPGDWSAGYHTGVDFGNAATGDAVTCITDGKVVNAGLDPEDAYGQSVRVKSGDLIHMYCHLSSVDVNEGDQVKQGDRLGAVGNTGRSFGDHLHLEVRESPYKYGEDDLDPVAFITGGMMSAGGAMGSGGGGGSDFWQPAPSWETQAGYDPDDPVDQLFGDNAWVPIMAQNTQETVEANSLTGMRALLNDQPLLPHLKNLFSSTMRSFCSAPNGDLIGWFPDYYGLWGVAAKLRIEPIEIQDFNVVWSDDMFVTHQFAVAANYTSLDLATGAIQSNLTPVYHTLGVANIDMPEVMESLLGVAPESHTKFAQWVYNRFGARPDFQEMHGMYGPRAEFFAALYLFQRQWAYQYNADVPVTFMPEAWPGMLMQVPRFDFQAYIVTVTHTFRFGEGGGFNTTINIAAPAYMPRHGKANKNHALFGLPIAGGYSPGRGIGNPPGLTAQGAPVDTEPLPAAENPKVTPGAIGTYRNTGVTSPGDQP